MFLRLYRVILVLVLGLLVANVTKDKCGHLRSNNNPIAQNNKNIVDNAPSKILGHNLPIPPIISPKNIIYPSKNDWNAQKYSGSF